MKTVLTPQEQKAMEKVIAQIAKKHGVTETEVRPFSF